MFAEDDCGEKENALAKEPPPLHPPPPCIVVRKTRENEMNDDIVISGVELEGESQHILHTDRNPEGKIDK